MRHSLTPFISPTRTRAARSRLRLGAGALALALGPVLAVSATSQAAVARHQPQGIARAAAPLVSPKTPYPDGVINRAEPSHLAPPGPHALAGFTRIYVDDFNGGLNPYMWFRFKGQPSGDPGGYFAPSHVSTSRGRLVISTYRDSSYGGGWISGGAGLYRVHPTYGAFFVRSRQTAVGADNVELLWPSNNQWPPEIDFNETGVNPTLSTWTVHYDNASSQDYFSNWHVNITHWHTWGVIWTPTYLKFTLDGHKWGPTVTNSWEIPRLAMALDLQQQSWCGVSPDCPKVNSSLVVDWVAVYVPR